MRVVAAVRSRLSGHVRRPHQIHRRAIALARAATPAIMAAGALAAIAMLALGFAGCASQEVSVGGVRIEPGTESVYVLSQRSDAGTACRDAAVRAVALGTSGSTARIARCTVSGSTITCAEEEISCLGIEPAEQ
jgi:hypothetical protein